MTKCINCNIEMEAKKGKYGMFLSCPNWQEKGCKTVSLGDKPEPKLIDAIPDLKPETIKIVNAAAPKAKEFKLTNENINIGGANLAKEVHQPGTPEFYQLAETIVEWIKTYGN